jgi:hypothetical protein
MNFRIQQDAVLIKQLKSLRKTGGRSALVADHVNTIMQRFLLNESQNPKQLGRLTRYGEERIKNCIKYDLIDGYRLIAMKQDQEITFLYVGPHDECSRWIRNNRRLHTVVSKNGNEVLGAQKLEPPLDRAESDTIEECDEYLAMNIDEHELRKVFCGLAGEHKGP